MKEHSMKTHTSEHQTFGIVAEFESSGALLHAAEKLSGAGYKRYDAHSPFPIHGMDEAMKLGQSKLGLIVFICGLTGFSLGLGLQTWVHSFEYPLIIGGKPFFALPAYIPVTFELTVLLSAFGAVFGMFALNRLPMPYHAVFNHSRFHEASNNAFFISVQADDPNFDATRTKDLLAQVGGKNIEVVNA
jgi:Protein of unknown function (DUF3341)